MHVLDKAHLSNNKPGQKYQEQKDEYEGYTPQPTAESADRTKRPKPRKRIRISPFHRKSILAILILYGIGFLFIWSRDPSQNIEDLSGFKINQGSSSLKGGSKGISFKEPETKEQKEQRDVDAKFRKDNKLPFFQENFTNPLPFNQISKPVISAETYIPVLQIECTLNDQDHLNLIIRDANNPRWELPSKYPYPYSKNPQFLGIEESNFSFEFSSDPFNIIIKRRSTGEVIFKWTDRLVFTDLYIEFTFQTPTNNIYGFGERIAPLQYKSGTYSLFISDHNSQADPGQTGFNTQGHHPMYLNKEKSGRYHIVFLKNTNSQEIVLTKDSKITWKTIGGVIDLSFFLGDTPESAVEKYHDYIGGWTLPNLWHLGHHQSKWRGYKNITDVENVLAEFERAKLPLDALWSHLDYLKADINFFYDSINFPPQKVAQVFQAYNKKWIPIATPYIPWQEQSFVWAYTDVIEIALMDGKDTEFQASGGTFSGQVFFVDFLHPQSQEFWNLMLQHLSEKAVFSGVWLDSNEVSNFAPLKWWNRQYDEYKQDTIDRKYYNLPFQPGNKNFYESSMICPDSLHYGDIEEYNFRSATCLHQSQQSYNYLNNSGSPLPFVLSRGTMFGSGQFAYHSIPDVGSSWEMLRTSMGSILSFGIFGIPMVGADICGVAGTTKTSAELCARWYQLSIFYPFARNHHALSEYEDNSQEPYKYEGPYFDSIAASMRYRYSILKQVLTLFFTKKGDTKKVGTILKPLFFGFHNDNTLPLYGDKVHEEQFLLGDLIMAAPSFYQDATSVNVYFPNCRWFDLRDYKEIDVKGQSKPVSSKVDELPPHFLRGGNILFQQETEGVLNSDNLSNSFKLVIGLDTFVINGDSQTSYANGSILATTNYKDQYVYQKCLLESCVLYVNASYKMDAQNKKVAVTLEMNSPKPMSIEEGIMANEFLILGVPKESLGYSKEATCEGCDAQSISVEVMDGWIRIKTQGSAMKNGSKYTFNLN